LAISEILAGEIHDGDLVRVGIDSGREGLTFNVVAPLTPSQPAKKVSRCGVWRGNWAPTGNG